MFILYDIETTGTNIAYDQILQFGAILADAHLVEIDRFEIRCRLLPWIVPAPGALLVTQTSVSRLEDPWFPDFFNMMRAIADRLASWGAATYIGYNSMRFDEPFLQRAFWQALLPPYLTVTGGNARLDLLPLLRAAAYFRPGVLNIPAHEDGAANFRLDDLAPANGFDGHRAHQAIGDVEATLFLARLVAERVPELWQPLVARASKAAAVSILALGSPIFYFRHGGGAPGVSCYQRIDAKADRCSHAVLARLGYDWLGAKAKIDSFRPGELAEMRRSLRRVALNKAPLVFSLPEAKALAGLAPSAPELDQAHFLASDKDYCSRLVKETGLPVRKEASGQRELEDMIFDDFSSPKDDRLMADFQRADPTGQAMIARAFADLRFRRLATRILFLSAPQVLTSHEKQQIRLGIVRRLTTARDNPHPWRSIPDALVELADDSQQVSTPERAEIAAWLQQRLKNTW